MPPGSGAALRCRELSSGSMSPASLPQRPNARSQNQRLGQARRRPCVSAPLRYRTARARIRRFVVEVRDSERGARVSVARLANRTGIEQVGGAVLDAERARIIGRPPGLKCSTPTSSSRSVNPPCRCVCPKKVIGVGASSKTIEQPAPARKRIRLHRETRREP